MISEILSTNKGKKVVLRLRCKIFHYIILSLIEERPINAIDIYEIFGIKNMNNKKYRQKITGLLRNFIRKEFISSLIDVCVDSRTNIYFLTTKGKTYLELIRSKSESELECLIEECLT